MKKFLDKKISVKSILVFLLICIMIPVVTVCFHYATTLSRQGMIDYAIKNSEVNSQEFFVFELKGTGHKYAVSEDRDCDNEIFLFDDVYPVIEQLQLGGDRVKKPKVSATSDKEVGALQWSEPVAYDDSFEDTYLVYYSNNKSKIRKCVYEYNSEGDTFTTEVKIAMGEAFAFAIPLVTNHENNRREIIKASFYGETGELIFEDIP